MFFRIKRFFNNRFLAPVIALLKQGTAPKEIALAITGSLLLGIFPVVGSTTILCALFAWRFRLNIPLTQLINYSMTPVQLLTIVPLMKAGEIFGFEKLNHSLSEILNLVGTAPLTAISVLWNVTMQAIGAWCIFASLSGYIIYRLLLNAVNKLSTPANKA